MTPEDKQFQPGDIVEFRPDEADDWGGHRAELIQTTQNDYSTIQFWTMRMLTPVPRSYTEGETTQEAETEFFLVERPSNILTSRSSWQ